MAILSNAERLEKCKTFADANDIDWLINRVEVLEANLIGATEVLDEAIASYTKSVNQNVRLREALKEISEMYSDGKSPVLDHWGMLTIAKSALEETK